MRTTCRFLLGVAVFAAGVGIASAQQPEPQPSLPPLPEAQVTPVPVPPDIVPPMEQSSPKPVLVLVPIAPTATARPARKASRIAATKPAPATASKKPEAAAAASVAATGSWSPPPAAAAAAAPANTVSPRLSQKAPPAVDPAVQAEMEKKVADAAQRKKTVGGRILLGVGGLALIGLAVYFVRSRRHGAVMVPPIFVALPAPVAVVSAPTVRPAPDRR